ncbi:DEAD/DEAH box helicase [Flexibacterium corallicola]|uniref:DEAD/DEAH box helicase n=1 Tax=Flexibacterium corallicola TaxID=3037259 RepID=UPI00286EE1B4|nr:DEAD/DEAH box helicase [Pseudovibrio sp. M1P-2-3]
MVDLSRFPCSFLEIMRSPPEGYTISERILDAEILLDRVGGKITAQLVGIRNLKGRRQELSTPSHDHPWVVDGSVLRPLPSDAVKVFNAALNNADPERLDFKTAVHLLEDETGILPVTATARFQLSGGVVASNLPEKTDILGLNANLFPYQARGVQWMNQTIASTGGLILADEMGLGKTLQIIALLLLDPPSELAPALIVCPTSLIANWVREIKKFGPSLSVLVHRGPNRTGVFRGLQRSNLVITTYDTMVNDIAIFSAFEWSWVICDEAQAIKNPDSNRRQAIVSIPRQRTIPMTGTPVENTLMDLWSLMDFAIPGLLKSRKEFQAKYPDSLESAREIGKISDPVTLKRRVADVADDLPERIDIDLPLELGEALADYYRDVREETLARYPVAGALVATLQLQLVCAHPWLRQGRTDDEDGEFAEIERSAEQPLLTPKMERTVELLYEAFANGRKVIIFALFNRLGDLIREAGKDLPEAYWGAINGSTDQSDRQIIIDEFSAYGGPACLVLNPKAAGAGLNITAATIVIHYTPVWNPALEAQASARAHRRGQTLPVTIYRLFYEDTVERVMLDRSGWKHELGNEIMPMATRDREDFDRALAIEPRNS